VVRLLQCFSNDSVIVDFAIDGQGNAIIFVGDGLGPAVNTNNAQTLVCQNCSDVSLLTEKSKGVLLVSLAM
jgi:hypothetical protein